MWILDWRKWRNHFVQAGIDVPDEEASAPERFDIVVVDEYSVDEFLQGMHEFELSKHDLRLQLLNRYEAATSWWDVSDLFPIVFVDFDNKKLGAFYFDGAKMERYAPDGWEAEFVDFANCYPDEIFPEGEKFWVANGMDMLKGLNERGASKV